MLLPHITPLLSLILTLILLPRAYSAIQQPSLSTITLYHSRSAPTTTPSSSTPQPLAILSYLPNRPYLSKISSFTPPSNTTAADADDDYTQVITYLSPDKQQFRSSSTATLSFHAPAKGRFRLNVAQDGTVLGASWRCWLPKPRAGNAEKKEAEESQRRGAEAREDNGDFDLVMQQLPPLVMFEKPNKGSVKQADAAKGAGAGGVGEEEVVEEKSLFQKYVFSTHASHYSLLLVCDL